MQILEEKKTVPMHKFYFLLTLALIEQSSVILAILYLLLTLLKVVRFLCW